jgi:hypothetical protein
MSIDFGELRDLELEDEEQREWWEANRQELTRSEKDELFHRIFDEQPFHYLRLIIELSLDNLDNPPRLVENLERLVPHIDGDLAWRDLYDAFRSRVDGNEDLSWDIYELLIETDDEWLTWMAGVALAQLPENQMRETTLDLLQADAGTKVRAGLQATLEQYQGQELPEEYISAFRGLALESEPATLQELVRANVVLFEENNQLWDMTVDIAERNPETIPWISRRFASKIEDEHLEEYIQILKHGIENGQDVDLTHANHFLQSNFAHATNTLAEFTIWLDNRDVLTSNRLAEDVSRENPEYLPELFRRLDDYEHPLKGQFSFIHAGRSRPDELVQLILDNYDEENSLFYLELLRKALGELFEHDDTHRSTVEDIYEFLVEHFSSEQFVHDLDRDRLNLDDPDAYDEERALGELREFLIELHTIRDFDDEILDTLDEYESLSAHFHDLVETRIETGTPHPFLYLLRDEMRELDFLEDNWDRIPQDKRDDLLASTGFYDFLSEIMFYIHLDNQSVAFEPEVPLHDWQTDEPKGNVDLVVDDIFIDIYRPEAWTPLALSNRGRFIPNNAESKILGKFKSKFLGTREMADNPCFIALDIDRSEIDREQVVAALLGSMQVRIYYDEETGETVGEDYVRNTDERLEGDYYLLDKHLNGVIWYETDLVEGEDGVMPALDLGVVPNPEHEDGESNFELCQKLERSLTAGS